MLWISEAVPDITTVYTNFRRKTDGPTYIRCYVGSSALLPDVEIYRLSGGTPEALDTNCKNHMIRTIEAHWSGSMISILGCGQLSPPDSYPINYKWGSIGCRHSHPPQIKTIRQQLFCEFRVWRRHVRLFMLLLPYHCTTPQLSDFVTGWAISLWSRSTDHNDGFAAVTQNRRYDDPPDVFLCRLKASLYSDVTTFAYSGDRK